MRKYKANRSKAKTPYEAYEYWYKKYTKGYKEGWFAPKYTEDEFNEQYELAKKAGIKVNIAKTIAASQEFVDRTFEKRYKELYGTHMPDIRDKAARIRMFEDFVAQMELEGMTYDQAREEFEKYFY